MPTKISWSMETWNPITGCTRVSSGCDNCYAVKMTKRLAAMGQDKYKGLVNIGKDHFNGIVKTHDDALLIPLKWKKPRQVFVNSMSDLFHPGVPFEFIDKVFAVMALCPQHTFQILTKRPERMAEYLLQVQNDFKDMQCWINAALDVGLCESKLIEDWDWPLRNIWLGTSVENQETADERIPHLLKCPAAVRFLSCEPLLGAVDLSQMAGASALRHDENPYHRKPEIHWVICGGESGSGFRKMELSWLCGIANQCRDAGVPVFVKQDSAFQNERQGRIPDEYWALKQFPVTS